jgi:hypothetical protein
MLDRSAAQPGSKLVVMFRVLAVSVILSASCFGKFDVIAERYSVIFTFQVLREYSSMSSEVSVTDVNE